MQGSTLSDPAVFTATGNARDLFYWLCSDFILYANRTERVVAVLRCVIGTRTNLHLVFPVLPASLLDRRRGPRVTPVVGQSTESWFFGLCGDARDAVMLSCVSAPLSTPFHFCRESQVRGDQQLGEVPYSAVSN